MQKKQNKIEILIRWMIRRDMNEVLTIESQSFEFPWCEDDFIRCLRQRNCVGMVAEHNEQVVGFMIYELHKSKLHILNFAVSNGWKRKSIGSQMVQKLIEKLSQKGRKQIMLEVRETNLIAQLFFKSQGFRATSILHNFYEDTDEEAYLMTYNRYLNNIDMNNIDDNNEDNTNFETVTT